MKRIWTLGLIITVILAVFLTACGNGKSENASSSAPAASPSESASPETTEPETTEPEKTEPVNLKMVYWDPGQKEIMEKINSKFTEENPSVTVELELVPADQYDQVLKTRFLSDSGPDVYMYFGTSVHIYGKNGYFGDLTNESFAGNVLPAFTGPVSYEGKLYAIPLNTTTTSIFYNKKAFEKAGITEAPKTYAEFLEACEKLKQAGIIPIARGAKDVWTSLHELGPIQAAFVTSRNDNFQADRFNETFKFASNPDMKNFLTKYVELVDKGYIDKGVLGMNHSQAVQEVADGKSAMLMGISVFYGELKAANKDTEYGYFQLPDENGKYSIIGGSDKAIGYWPGTKHADEAKKLLAFYATPAIDQMYCEATQMLPTLKDVTVNLDEPLQLLAKDIAAAPVVYNWFDVQWPLPAQDAFRQGVQNIHAGNKDVDKLLASIDKAYDENKSSITAPAVK